MVQIAAPVQLHVAVIFTQLVCVCQCESSLLVLLSLCVSMLRITLRIKHIWQIKLILIYTLSKIHTLYRVPILLFTFRFVSTAALSACGTL